VSDTTPNLSLLRNACSALLDDASYNDFWVLAGLTDRSYEEGDRNGAFSVEIEHHESAGLPMANCAELRRGINGNLADLLSRQNSGKKVKRNKWAGQDLSITGSGAPEATAEVKLIYDCTMSKYYQNVVNDVNKLERLRADDFDGDLFCVIFFVSLPNYVYPRGEWFGQQWSSRSEYMRNCGISNQFGKATSYLGKNPDWPSNGRPYVRRLNPPGADVCAVVTKLFTENFSTSESWHFDPLAHIHNGEVGVAVWQIP
jgi:hypothetical protein